MMSKKSMMQLNLWLMRHPGQIAAVLGLLIGFSLGSQAIGWLRVANALMVVAGILGTVPIAWRAWQALRTKTISIELLVTIACIGALAIGEPLEAAVVTFLFMFGSVLEARTLAKTRSAVKALTDMAPQQADVRQADGTVVTVDVDEIEVGDQVIVRPGGQIPVDGTILSGTGIALEAVITGEAKPVNKRVGDAVYAGTMLDSGMLTVTTEAAGEASTFGQIVSLVEEAQDAQAPIARFIDRFATFYTPAVLVIAGAVWLATQDLALAITILVLGCPGALVIGAPVANVAGIGRAASQGILFKGGQAVAGLAKVDTLMLDKTGTITTGQMTAHQVTAFGGDENQRLAELAAIEAGSDHPLARAIVAQAKARGIELTAAPDMVTVKGMGLVSADQQQVVGNLRLMAAQQVTVTATVREAALSAQAAGNSVVLYAKNGQVELLVAVSDVVRPDVAAGLTALKQQGIQQVIMLTGDNQTAAKQVAAQLPIDRVQAELLPQEKLAIVQAAQAAGHRVAFVGDGINDAPALATADVGVGMGGGTAVALETADVVLVQATFETLRRAHDFAVMTTRVTTQNIIIAVGTVALLLLGLLMGLIHMGSGMFVHEASILLVIANAMRLLHKK